MSAIWQCEAYRTDIAQAVDRFVRDYWQEPRKRTALKVDGDGVTFGLVDGRRLYRCRGVRGTPPLYVITVEPGA